MGKTKNIDVVIRIRKQTHERLRSYEHILKLPPTKKGKPKKPTINEILDMILDGVDKMYQTPVYYVNGHHVQTDLAVARGQAIMHAIQTKTPVVFPLKVVVAGQDDGALVTDNTHPIEQALKK